MGKMKTVFNVRLRIGRLQQMTSNNEQSSGQIRHDSELRVFLGTTPTTHITPKCLNRCDQLNMNIRYDTIRDANLTRTQKLA